MKVLVIMLTLVIPKITYTQVDDFKNNEIDSLYESENRKVMESMMVWKLTEELELDVDQAERFFPRYREHRKEIETLRKKEQILAKTLRLNMKQNKKLTGSEVNKIIKESSSLKRKMADLEESFLINSAKVLSPNQQAKLGLFKNKMMRNMKGKMKDKRSRDKKRRFRNDRKKNKREFWN